MDYLNKVKVFHEIGEAVVSDFPTLASCETQNLRLGLLKEELKEYEESLEKADLLGVLDALIDIQYVLSGAILAHGLQNIFDEGFKLVHKNNMSKFIKNDKNAMSLIRATQELYESKGIKVYFKLNEEHDYYVCMRASDHKIVKPIGFKSVELEGLFNDQLI